MQKNNLKIIIIISSIIIISIIIIIIIIIINHRRATQFYFSFATYVYVFPKNAPWRWWVTGTSWACHCCIHDTIYHQPQLLEWRKKPVIPSRTIWWNGDNQPQTRCSLTVYIHLSSQLYILLRG